MPAMYSFLMNIFPSDPKEKLIDENFAGQHNDKFLIADFRFLIFLYPTEILLSPFVASHTSTETMLLNKIQNLQVSDTTGDD
jgi:hypothetical protein